MTDPLELELHALQTGAAVLRLSPEREPALATVFLRISGSDATRWLNGMVTNAARDLQPGQGQYNFLLNAQGRIQADCLVYREPGGEEPPSFALETTAAQMPAVQALLDRYIIMDDVELTPMEAFSHSILLVGPRALAVMQATGDPLLGAKLAALPPLTLAPPDPAQVWISTPAAHPASAATPAVLFHAGEAMVDALAEDLLKAGAVAVSPGAVEAHRVLAGVPRFGQDIRDRDLPQETGQEHALHFHKGCYLGQEIVERIRSRGQVHRVLTPFVLEGELPELPAALESGGKTAGELTSAVRVGGKLFGLGYARREFLLGEATFTYPGGTARPRSPGTAGTAT